MNIEQYFNQIMEKMKKPVSNINWSNKNVYGNWLAQSYYFVRHSTRLLNLSATNTSFEQENYHRRLGAHISEEQGHEDLALTDLKKLGLSIADFSELTSNKLFYRNQYFGCSKISPFYLMGYILFLEGFAVYHGKHILDNVVATFGTRSSNFIRVHVEEDGDHLEDALKQIENLNEIDKKAVLESLEMSYELYRNILFEVSIIKSTYSEATA